jgi:hypothetical protein
VDIAQAAEHEAMADALKDMGIELDKPKTRGKATQKAAEDRLARGVQLCSTCGLPYPKKQLQYDIDGRCTICVNKMKAGETPVYKDIDAMNEEFQALIEQGKAERATAAVTKKKQARSDLNTRQIKAPATMDSTTAKAEPADVTAPSPLPRGWVSDQIRTQWTMGYTRRQITDSMAKALNRPDFKYQQVFQTIKQMELKAPMDEDITPVEEVAIKGED